MTPEHIELVQTWLDMDPDPETREELQRLLADDDPSRWQARFAGSLRFGTAGLRAPLQAGPMGMNRVVVRWVAHALGQYLLTVDGGACVAGVVIGYDGRRNSDVFAQDTATVLQTLGFQVWMSPGVVPTPVLAHAVRQMGAAAGVMVTASHNPPGDNGYKVYWRGGAQIVPPHDGGIQDAMQRFHPTNDLMAWPDLTAPLIPVEVIDDYVEQVLALRVRQAAPVRVVYSAMHGVGSPMVRRVLSEAGYTDVHVVKEQDTPDPAFPTVSFPNPEEPGALDLSLALAERVQADVLVVNDPDADRLSVSVPHPSGGWRTLTGNQVGVLLADELLGRGLAGGRPALVATTIVSTSQLQRVADAHGASHELTLTGFKWLAEAGKAFEATGGRMVLGFEEALGYSVGGLVRDKDGVSAALVLVDMVAGLKAEGRTLWDELERLARRDGLYASRQVSTRFEGPDGAEQMAALMARLREASPSEIAGEPVVAWWDVEQGTRRTAEGIEELSLPRSNALAWMLQGGGKVLARPSGTEPKLKLYFEACVSVPGTGALADADAEAQVRLDAMEQAMKALVTQ